MGLETDFPCASGVPRKQERPAGCVRGHYADYRTSCRGHKGCEGLRWGARLRPFCRRGRERKSWKLPRSEEHTSELQSQSNLVCRLLLEKKKKLVNSNYDC